MADERRMFVAMLMTGAFMVAEVIGGLVSGSLALLADAGHMLTDTASLALAWGAARASRRPADTLRSYGYHRVQILAAFLNGIAILAIVVWILFEAAQRLMEPVQITGGLMLAIAVLGLVVNMVVYGILHGGNRRNLNLRGALVHVLGDLMGSVATILAALIILWTGWMPIDSLLSVLVAMLIARSAWLVVKQSTHILLEGTPENMDAKMLRRAIMDAMPEVADVHHIHVWSLTPERPLVTLHVQVAQSVDHAALLCRIKALLVEQFGIEHSTVQLEPESCPDEGAPVSN